MYSTLSEILEIDGNGGVVWSRSTPRSIVGGKPALAL